MTTLPISFSSLQLPTALSLQQYFQGTSEIEPVLKEATKEEITSSDLDQLQSRWGYVCFYLRTIIQTIHSVCVKILGRLAHMVNAENLARRCKVHAYHLEKDWHNLRSLDHFGSHFLMPMVNTHRRDTEDLYLIPAQPSLDGPNSPFIQFNFYHRKGVCRGIGDLFLFLYLKAKDKFKSTENLIRAVSKVFEQGAPREAAILQSMKSEDINRALNIKSRYVTGFVHPELDLAQLSKHIFNLPQGEYAVTAYFAGHRVNFICDKNAQRYLIDPTFGTFKLSNENELVTHFKENLPKPKNLPDSMKQVWIEQITLNLEMDKKIPSR